MAKQKKEHDSCIILRTMEIEHNTLNIETGKWTFLRKSIETKPCGIPLFSTDDRAKGVCKSCKKGWEVDGNVFATEAEKKRATQ